jgi:hypothetical protein
MNSCTLTIERKSLYGEEIASREFEVRYYPSKCLNNGTYDRPSDWQSAEIDTILDEDGNDVTDELLQMVDAYQIIEHVEGHRSARMETVEPIDEIK